MNYPDFISNKFLNQDVYIVGSGASLIGFDYSFFQNKIVIAINHAFKLVNAQYLVFNDAHFINIENKGNINFSNIILCPKRTNKTGPNYINFDLSNRFSVNPLDGVYMWRSSALSALTIALQGSAKNIYLWGLDYRFFTKNEIIKIVQENSNDINFIKHIKGTQKLIWTHSTDDTFLHTMNQPKDLIVFKDVIKYFNVFQTMNNIFNMSKYSAIPYFKKG